MYHALIEDIFRRNLECRHMAGIHLPDMFRQAVESLSGASHIAIVTGFVVKSVEAGETDGPPGALMMAKCFEKMGKKVTLITDRMNEAIMKKGMATLEIESSLLVVEDDTVQETSEKLLVEEQVSHLIAIERPSRASDGQCYSMRGEVITAYVANTDILFHRAKELGIITIGIGDGGNEVGMATIKDYVYNHVPRGQLICASTEVDYLIIGGVSNWVAYGICGALSISEGKLLLHEAELEKQVIEDIVSVGAVDGMAKMPISHVDGIDMSGNLEILSDIRSIIYKFMAN